MTSSFHRETTDYNGYVEMEHFTNNEFGVFLELGYKHDSGIKAEWTMVEIPRKKARRLAKAILKATKKRK